MVRGVKAEPTLWEAPGPVIEPGSPPGRADVVPSSSSEGNLISELLRLQRHSSVGLRMMGASEISTSLATSRGLSIYLSMHLSCLTFAKVLPLPRNSMSRKVRASVPLGRGSQTALSPLRARHEIALTRHRRPKDLKPAKGGTFK